MRAPAPRSDLVPLADRLTVLAAVRLAMVAVVAATAVLAPGATRGLDADVALATVGFAAVTVVAEVGRRLMARVRAITLVNVLLLVDGAWLAVVVHSTGGPDSALAFLLFLHVVAVTVLLSYRTGLKVTAWHTLLSFVVYFVSA
ncbi:MAG TPA: hypothetical protein VGB03_05975, partial [Acidimicrobiales bacterium]